MRDSGDYGDLLKKAEDVSWGAVLSADLVVHLRVPDVGRSLCGVQGPFVPVGVVVGTTFCPECLDEWRRIVEADT